VKKGWEFQMAVETVGTAAGAAGVFGAGAAPAPAVV